MNNKNFVNTFWLLLITVLLAGCAAPPSSVFDVANAQKTEAAAWAELPSILARIKSPEIPAMEHLATDFGILPEKTSGNHEALKALIRKVDEAGGGRIIFPPGTYFMDGPIHMCSNLNLHVEKGATIWFTDNPEAYLPAVKVRWEGTVCYNYSPLIYAYQKENIALTGEGLIDGRAKEWSENWRKKQNPDKKRLRQMGNDTLPEVQRVFANGFLDLDGDGQDDGFGDGKEHFLRPTLVELYQCKNILMEGLEFRDSPFWTLHPVFSQNITIRGVKIFSDTWNDDGIDPDGSEDVLIEGCEIATTDDAISIKAGRDQDAWNRPGSRNIVVRNNRLLSHANAFCIGSEMSGGVEYVFAENNYIANGQHALNFKCNLDRGGQVQHVYIRNTEIDSCRDAMFIFRMDYHGYRGNHFPTKFNDFYVSGITCKSVNKKPFKIVGVEEEPISRVYLRDIVVGNAGEASQLEHSSDILFDQVTIAGREFNWENNADKN